MVDRAPQANRRAAGNFTAKTRRLLDDSTYAEDAGLAQVEDWRKGVDTPRAEIGHGERSAAYVLELETACARFFTEFFCRSRDLAKAPAVCRSNNRND